MSNKQKLFNTYNPNPKKNIKKNNSRNPFKTKKIQYKKVIIDLKKNKNNNTINTTTPNNIKSNIYITPQRSPMNILQNRRNDLNDQEQDLNENTLNSNKTMCNTHNNIIINNANDNDNDNDNSKLKINDDEKNNNNNNNNNSNSNHQIKKHKPEINENCVFSIEKMSKSIDKNETNKIKTILESNYDLLESGQYLSDVFSAKIKKRLPGEWFVFVSNKKDNISLNISALSEDDYLIICLGNTKFQIARIK